MAFLRLLVFPKDALGLCRWKQVSSQYLQRRSKNFNIHNLKTRTRSEDYIEPNLSAFGSKRRRFFEKNRLHRLKQQKQTATATWMNTIVARGTDFEILDSKVYFREQDVNWDVLEKCERTKQFNPIGLAQLYNIVVKKEGRSFRNKEAAWKFSDLKDEWKPLERRMAFWKGINIFITCDKDS
eukprot:jgi/Galph1/2913/GphlegSOOS_G1588.1